MKILRAVMLGMHDSFEPPDSEADELAPEGDEGEGEDDCEEEGEEEEEEEGEEEGEAEEEEEVAQCEP